MSVGKILAISDMDPNGWTVVLGGGYHIDDKEIYNDAFGFLGVQYEDHREFVSDWEVRMKGEGFDFYISNDDTYEEQIKILEGMHCLIIIDALTKEIADNVVQKLTKQFMRVLILEEIESNFESLQ